MDANQSTTLTWTSSGARWCYSRGVWGGARSNQGTFDTGPLTKKTWYGITCSDGKNEVSDSVTVVVREAQPALSVKLSASPAQVNANGSSTLSWTSTGARWCYSRGVWGGSRSKSGSFNTGPLTKDTWYGITCSDGNKEVTDGVTVKVAGGGAALSAKLQANPQNISAGEASTLTWSSTGADWCWGGGGWKGGKPLSGSVSTGALSQNTTFKLTCAKRSGERAVTTVAVQVAGTAPVVRWQAPNRNVDGTPLNDLAGYKFYWGQQSGNYTDSASVNDPNKTQYQPAQLPPGRYFVAVTAIDASGNESGYSNEIQVTVQ